MITDEEVEDFLEHFGVKGMRWGVRRRSGNTPASGSSKPDGKIRQGNKRKAESDAADNEKRKQDEEKAAPPNQRPVMKTDSSQMTTAELRAALERINLERQYNALIYPPGKKTTGEAAVDWIGNTMKESGQSAIREVSKEVAKNVLRSSLKAAFDKQGWTNVLPDGKKKKD